MRRAVAFAPGRVNLIGEHTDYNQGLALPFAIETGVTVKASELSRPWIEAQATDVDELDSFPLSDPPRAEGSWSRVWLGYCRSDLRVSR